jgi:hypothetical protein
MKRHDIKLLKLPLSDAIVGTTAFRTSWNLMKPNFKLPLVGRCQCKGVVYKTTSAPLAVYACHCTECQRQSGSAFSLSLLAERGAVVVEEGKPAVWERQHESGRVIDCLICATCGTRLFHEPRANTKVTIVKAGNLDDRSWLFPVGHIWTRSALRRHSKGCREPRCAAAKLRQHHRGVAASLRRGLTARDFVSQ